MRTEPKPVEVTTIGYADATRRTGLQRTSLENLVKDGTLRSAKVGKRRLIYLRDLDALIERCTVSA